MLQSYLKIAMRNLFRNKVFSFINIAGLSIGLACCMLIFLYTKDEVSYDRFQERKDNIYRLTGKIVEKNGTESNLGVSYMVQGPGFKQEIPEIEEFVRVQDDQFIVKKGNETFNEQASWVDENFFSVFSFPLIAGDPKKVLSDINSIVLTDEIAEKYFGSSSNAIGKTLEFEIQNKFVPFVVSGIAKKSPQNSSIKFKMLLPFKYQEKKNPDTFWMNFSYPTFFVMNPKANLKTVVNKMARVYATKAKDQLIEEKKHGFEATITWGLQPFMQMHLDTKYLYTPEGSNPIYSYILTAIAVFILLIACINFVNLTVAQSIRRSKEIGVRKVVGGQRKQLVLQFLGESFIICIIAFSLAFALAQLALPIFNDLSNKRLSLSYLFDYQLVVGFIGLFLVTVFAAGFYPALVLSGLDPVQTLYNRSKFVGKNYLSKGLVVLQFALATFLIITTLFIYAQFDYLTHKDLGYNDKNLLVVSVGQGGDKHLMELFKNEFSQNPGVQIVAPRMMGYWGTGSKANGKEIGVRYEHIDENYLPILQVPLVAGRNFSKDFPADSTNSVLVNEAYVKAAGWKGSAIGKTVDFLNGKERKLLIVGVVKDYHFESLKEKIKPQLFTVDSNLPFGKFLLKIKPEKIPQTIKSVEKTYRTLVPYRPFKYDFMDDLNFKNYENEAKWKQIISFAAIITIFISCIGLFGLTTLSIQQRTKEIGIRKVLGATILQISGLLSKNFVLLVFMAFLLAIPAAWYATSRWLENFAYKINISWQIFAIAALLTIVIALLTVSYNTIKAAIMNPVKSLKTE